MKLIVGLGNPGKQYEKTRHNAGFMALDFLAEHFGLTFKTSDKHQCELAEGRLFDEKVILIKPQTFMNRSGQAVRSVARFFKIPAEDVVVVYDDADLPCGNLRIRPSGSAGGHKGLGSVIQELGSEQFTRVRFGIAPLTEFKGGLEDYVLGKLSGEEVNLMEGNIKKLPTLLETLFSKGIEEAMQDFN